METEKKVYSQIIKLMKKHQDILNFDVAQIEEKVNCHLFGLELKEVYGLNLDPKRVNSTSFNSFKEHIGLFAVGANHNNSISWSDDGRQPKNEMLLNISFPTGAYIFGGDYDYQLPLFKNLFDELKSYKPKYCDTSNKKLYFDLPNAKDVFNNFDIIMKKYHDLNKADLKNRKIEKLKKELENLQS